MAHWLKVKPGELPVHPIVGGTETNGEVLYIIRGTLADKAKGLLLGKIAASRKTAYVSFGGKEHSISEYEILCNSPLIRRGVRWVRTSGKDQPDGAIRGGKEQDGVQLYVGRVLMPNGHFVPGKINFERGKCYIPFGGKEHTFTDFYTLCQ